MTMKVSPKIRRKFPAKLDSVTKQLKTLAAMGKPLRLGWVFMVETVTEDRAVWGLRNFLGWHPYRFQGKPR